MRYLIILKALYLAQYYFVLSHRPSKMYFLSVIMASFFGIVLVFVVIFLSIFRTRNKGTSPYETFLFHGLSYEEWRTVDEVKKKMEKIRLISKKEDDDDPSGDYYLLRLLILSFFGMVECRPQTPEERSRMVFEGMPKEGETLKTTTYCFSNESDAVITETRREVDRQDAELFAAAQQAYLDYVQQERYQGATLSRLVYDGVCLVFKRKKIGPKPPKKANDFLDAFGIVPK